MLVLLDYPSIQDLKEDRPISGYPHSIFKVAARYAEVGDHQLTLLFSEPPKFNNPSSFFHPKKNCPASAVKNPAHPKFGFLKDEYVAHYERARAACSQASLVLALGDLSLWALTGDKLFDYRGTILHTQSGLRVLASHNPRAIIKDHSLLPILAMDMRKAWQESLKARSIFPRRTLHVIESLKDMDEAIQACTRAGQFSFDIETSKGQITMICFAPSPSAAYVLPFWYHDHNFWSEEMEVALFLKVQTLLASPLRKVAHNSVYDLTYLLAMGLKVCYPVEDTMLKSHSNEIEWLKSLGFLGSIYTNEKAWKLMRVGKVKDRNKKDE